MGTTIVVVFLGVVLPIGLVAYLLVRLARRYIPWLKEGGHRYIPVLTAMVGLLIGAIPGLSESMIHLALAIAVPAGHMDIPITYPTGVFLGLLGGLLAPSIYAWVHKVIYYEEKKLKKEEDDG